MACVCEPILCSPGGGGFAAFRRGDSVSFLDCFSHTPAARRQPSGAGVHEVFADFGTATQAFHIGPATAATPGLFAGIEALHRIGATWSLADLFAPAAAAARGGVTVTPFQHHLATVVEPILRATPAAAELFAPGGSLLAPGDSFRNPGLADALELMATDGFAGSGVGDACVAAQADAGHLTAHDLAAYEAIERPPLTVDLAGDTVHLNPLPAAGGTLVAHTLHQLRAHDPVALANAIAATGEARSRAALDDLNGLVVRQRGTTHVSVIDAAGHACAVTVSNGEGNGALVGEFGFMLNNVLGEEDVNAHGPDDWPTATRLSSMMCPTIVEGADGSLTVLGSGGSNRIRSAIAQFLVRLCVDRADLADAVAAPRLHVERGRLEFEDRFDDEQRTRLTEAFPDHRGWARPDLFFGGVHAARRSVDGELSGAGDERRDGVAVVVDRPGLPQPQR